MKWGFLVTAISSFYSCFSQSVAPSPAARRVDSLVTLSRNYNWINSYRSLDYADQATVVALEIDYPAGLAMARIQKGFSFWTLGDNDQAIQEAMGAIDLGKKLGNSAILSEGNYVLARGYMDVAEGEKAWEAILEAERLALKANDWTLLCSIYNLKGVIQFIDNKQDSALVFYNKAYDLGQAHQVDPINFPRIISNIGECYLAKKPKRAFSYFSTALELAIQTNNQIAKASITSIIGHAYLRKNDLKKAEYNLNEALQLARKLGLRRVVRHAYGGLVDIKLRQGRGNEAVVYLRKYYDVHDSLMNKSKIRQIVELESKHALELKEQNIRILENEKRIQAIWNSLLFGLIVLIAFVAVGVYQLQRYQYRKNSEKLDLEIELLTRRSKETEERVKTSFTPGPEEPVESQDQKLLREAIAAVEAHLADPQFGVEQMADAMNVSRTGLHRKMKSITGFPPSEFIRTIRLRKAARLIASKADTASQVALLVGFYDYAHFSKSFKKHFGVSPTQYESGSGSTSVT